MSRFPLYHGLNFSQRIAHRSRGAEIAGSQARAGDVTRWTVFKWLKDLETEGLFKKMRRGRYQKTDAVQLTAVCPLDPLHFHSFYLSFEKEDTGSAECTLFHFLTGHDMDVYAAIKRRLGSRHVTHSDSTTRVLPCRNHD